MPTFGFSYVLKLLSMKQRPQRTAARKRLQPSGSGRDFHDSLRRLALDLLKGTDLEGVLASANQIKKEAERNSAKVGLKQLAKWREANPGRLISYPAVTFPSPGEQFSINFRPDFGLVIDGRATAVHLWNTKSQKLSDRMAYAALSWVPAGYAAAANPPEDFAVLSLRERRLLRLSDSKRVHVYGPGVFRFLDQLLIDARKALRLPSVQPDDRPAAS